MTTFQGPSLAEAETADGTRIPESTLAFFRERIRIKLHQILLREFVRREREIGLTRKNLADKLGKRREQITRWLGAPANMTIDTLSDLLLGMGVEPTFDGRNLLASEIVQPATAIAQPRVAASLPLAAHHRQIPQHNTERLDLRSSLAPLEPPKSVREIRVVDQQPPRTVVLRAVNQ